MPASVPPLAYPTRGDQPAVASRSPQRRRSSLRVGIAVALLVLAGVGLSIALLVGSQPAWVLAAAAAYAAGVAAARIVANELAESRRDHARARAQQAQADTLRAQATAALHRRVVDRLSRRLADTDADRRAIQAQLHVAQERLADTSQRMVRESRRTAGRIAAFQASVDQLRHELAEREAALAEAAARLAVRDDMLATWDGSEQPVPDDAASQHEGEPADVVDLMAWEQRALSNAPSGSRRKQA